MSDNTRKVERFEDMSPSGKLRLFQQPDGDVIVTVQPDNKETRVSPFGVSVEFTTFGGGGQSTATHKALIALMQAMEEDNEQRPQLNRKDGEGSSIRVAVDERKKGR